MNLWNNLTNWIDTWFNTNYLKLVNLFNFTKYNTTYLNKLITNNTKFSNLIIKSITTNLVMNKYIKLITFNTFNNYNLNNLICISKCKLNTYKFNVKQ